MKMHSITLIINYLAEGNKTWHYANVGKSRSYNIILRANSYNGRGTLPLKEDNTVLASFDGPATGTEGRSHLPRYSLQRKLQD